MIKKLLGCFLLILIVLNLSFAQNYKALYLLPHIGFEYTLSTFEDKNNLPPYILGAYTRNSSKFGLDIGARFNDWSVSLGYGWGNIGWGTRHRSQTDSAQFEVSGNNIIRNTVRRTRLSLARKVTTIKWVRKPSKFIDNVLRDKNGHEYWAILI